MRDLRPDAGRCRALRAGGTGLCPYPVPAALRLLLAAVATACTRSGDAAPSPAEAAPSALRCVSGPPIADKGVVESGERVEVAFEVENAGKESLRIATYRSSCGCTFVSGVGFPCDLDPGARVPLTLGVDTVRGPGPFAAHVELLDAAGRRLLTLAVRLRIDVRMGVDFPDPMHEIAPWGKDEARTLATRLRVFTSLDAPAGIERVELVDPRRWKAVARLEDATIARADGRYLQDVPITLELASWPESGSLDDTLEFDVEVNGRRFRPRLRVYGRAPRVLGLASAIVFIGRVSRGAAFGIDVPLDILPPPDLTFVTSVGWLKGEIGNAPESKPVLRVSGQAPEDAQLIDVALDVWRRGNLVETIRVAGAVR